MRRKKTPIVVIFVMLLFLSISLAKANIIEKSLMDDKEQILKEKISLLLNPEDKYRSLHEFYLMVWEILSLFIGHNIVSVYLARLCCCWIVFPIVCISEMLDVNASFPFKYYLENYLNEFIGEGMEDIFYRFGIFAFILLPFVFSFCFICAFVDAIQNMSISGGLLGRIQEALDYIYNPYQNNTYLKYGVLWKNDFKYSGFKQYVYEFKGGMYFFHTGLIGKLLVPFIYMYFLLCSIQDARDI